MNRLAISARTAELPASSRRIAPQATSNSGREPKAVKRSCDSLVEVVAACQRGDRSAYKQLYEACHRKVYGLAVRMVGLQDAADATQQVFLQVFRSIAQFNGRSQFETWLYRLAANESLQFLLRNRRGRYHALDWEPMDKSQHGDDVDRREALEHALARIDPELRSIFLLREVEELSYREIAEALEIPEGTVGSRLNRARRELRQHLSGLGFELS